MDASIRLQQLLSTLRDDPELLSALGALVQKERSSRASEGFPDRSSPSERGAGVSKGCRRGASPSGSEASLDDSDDDLPSRRALHPALPSAGSTKKAQGGPSRPAVSPFSPASLSAKSGAARAASRAVRQGERSVAAVSPSREARVSTTNPPNALPRHPDDDSRAYPDIPTTRARVAVPWRAINFRFPSIFNRDGLPHYPANRYLPLRAHDDQQQSDLEAAAVRQAHSLAHTPSVPGRSSGVATSDNLCLPALLTLLIVLLPLVLTCLVLTGVAALIDKVAET